MIIHMIVAMSHTLSDSLSVSQVKKHVVQVISAMAHHGYLELEGGELLVRFIVQHCALHDTYQVQVLHFCGSCLSFLI